MYTTRRCLIKNESKMIAGLLEGTHSEWHDILRAALSSVDTAYLEGLADGYDYLPTRDALLSAFKRPLSAVKYILFGESPYPRADSANGYAFWDAAVTALWSETGFSKAVNRATSLRNLLKMLLYARGDLIHDFSQPAIAGLDKSRYHQTLDALFTYLLDQGFMLLNASLVYEKDRVPYHAKHWLPFMETFLNELAFRQSEVKLLLFGRIAEKIPGHERFDSLIAEHPYNLSFMKNPDVIQFFKPMDLLINEK